MKGYISKFDRATQRIERQYPDATPEQKNRVVRQELAKAIVGRMTTIGKNINTGKFILTRNHPHDGINQK